MIGYFVKQNDMIFGEKNFIGSRIRTYEPRYPRFEEPRSRISQEPQRVEGLILLVSLGARGFFRVWCLRPLGHPDSCRFTDSPRTLPS